MYKIEVMNDQLNVWNVINWLVGVGFLAVGLVNVFWGNDPWFGVFIVVLSLFYLPPVNTFLKRKTGFTIPPIVKVLLGVFITWAALGVGELFDKIDLMIKSL